MAEKKSASMEEVGKLLEQGVRDLFTTEQYTTYLKAMDKFHQYSFNNQVLIAAQRPDATLVAGYRAWENNFHRHVKKGEQGIRIIAPVPVKEKVKRETGVQLADGTPETEETVRVVPRFRSVTVFDVSQTEGEPLPERPPARTLTAGVESYDAFMHALEQISPVPVRFDDISGTANGYYDATDKEIVLRRGMSESQTVKTAVHETVHARLHDPDRGKTGRLDQVTREVEAESTAFLVCHHFGIDTAAYTFPYIAAWSSSVEMRELRSSMDLICDTATGIISELEELLVPEREKKEFERLPGRNGGGLEAADVRGDRHLPAQCYSVLPSTGEIIIVKRGERGYYKTTAVPGDRAENRRLADRLNEKYGITREQEDALVAGSMFAPAMQEGRETPSRTDTCPGEDGVPGKREEEELSL